MQDVPSLYSISNLDIPSYSKVPEADTLITPGYASVKLNCISGSPQPDAIVEPKFLQM
jgi:hypothetical protein